MTEDKKKQFVPKNLRPWCHFYNGSHGDKELYLDVYTGVDYQHMYMIPLRKEILEPLGFEAVYDEYTSDIYFQRDFKGYRLRTFPTVGQIQIIDLKYLHTLVHAPADSLNELENYLYALGETDMVELVTPATTEINDFGKVYFKHFDEVGRTYEEFMEKHRQNKEEE